MRMRTRSLLACVVVAAATHATSWGQTKFTVSPENQPVDSASPETMNAFSGMNLDLAERMDEPASSCLKSYAVYQACKAKESSTPCAAAPACRVTAPLPAMNLSGMELVFQPRQEAAGLEPRAAAMRGSTRSIRITGAGPAPGGPVKIMQGAPLDGGGGGASASGAVAAPPGTAGGILGGAPAPVPPRYTGPPRISGGVLQGLRTNFVQPRYPEVARVAHLSGTVVLQAQLSKGGTIERLGVMSATNSVFDNAAIDAVRQWRYRPFLLNGEPTEVMTTITVNFALAPPASPPQPHGSMTQPEEHIPSMPH